MPPSPPPCKDDKEAGNESNNSTPSAPQSPQTTDKRGEASSEQNAMIDVMGGTTRLVSSRAGRADDRQALRDPSPPPTVKNPTEMSCGRSSKNAHHVAQSVLDRINDIASNNTSETLSPRILLRGEATTEQLLRPPAAAAASIASTESAATSHHHQRATSQSQLTQPLTSELLQASINAAVASVASQRRQADTTTNTRTEEGQAEASEMSVEKLVPCKKPRRKRAPLVKPGQTAGRWTHKEHQAFMEGLHECGREWKKVARRIPTRTSAQIRSHAQKYFAKLQRDHDAMVLPDSSHHRSAGSAAIPAEGSVQQMSSSVQNNVDRMLSNPNGAQREVENTLDALRERYRQLQRRLEQSQQRRVDATRARLVEDDPLHSSHRRKRALAELVDNHRVPHNDDHSSVSSAISASVASLGNDELVALHVLGGALPRGDSSSTDGAVRDVPPGSNHGSDTSIASNEEDCDQSTQSGEAKRRRKEG